MPPEGRSRPRGWLPLLGGVAAILGLVFSQAPGRIVPPYPVKLDLLLNPGEWFGRTLHLWEAMSWMGHVPNQAYGFLVPEFPFFALASVLDVPAWIVQRTWVALLLGLAFFGVVRLARALDVGTPWTRAFAGLAYALGPAVTTLLGSAFTLAPAALVPWTVIPLVHGARGGSERRAAARSALAIFAMGAANATSTISVLPLPAIWILTRRRGPRRRRLMAWWTGLSALACLWWLVALALQSRYGFDFLHVTERAPVTTASQSLLEVLRGTGAWIGYLNIVTPEAPGGWFLGTEPWIIVTTGALTGVGLFGLARADLRERFFLGTALAVGVVAMVIGYGGPLGSPIAGAVQHALDGPLIVFRNTLKFFPLVGIPIALGLAHVLALARRLHPGWQALSTLAIVGLLAGAVAPYAQGRVFKAGSFEELPGHWRDVAEWLAHDGRGERALLVPGAPFAEYVWGSPRDEPLLALAESPWVMRDIVPLGGAESIRWLDGVESVLEEGVASPGLAAYLARGGVRYLVVRNDLDWRLRGAPRPLVVREVLGRSPGLRRVAAFGPPAGTPGDAAADEFARREAVLQAVEIYRVEIDAAMVATFPARDPLLVVGGPEALRSLADHGLVGERAVLLPDEFALGRGATQIVITDSLRRRDIDFGFLRRNETYTLQWDELSPHTGREPEDYAAGRWPDAVTVAELDGADVASASSYSQWPARIPRLRPAAAFDGDRDSYWTAEDRRPGQWVDLRFDESLVVSSVQVVPLLDGPWRPRVRTIAVTTDQGTVLQDLLASEEMVSVRVREGPTRSVRVTLVKVDAAEEPVEGALPGLREVRVPGLVVRERMSVPSGPAVEFDPDRPPVTTFVFRSVPDRESRYLEEPGLDEENVMRRRFEVAVEGSATLSGSVVAVPGAERDALLEVARRPGDRFAVPCDSGPEVLMDGRAVSLSVEGSRRDLVEYRPIAFGVCESPAPLRAGPHDFEQTPGVGGFKVVEALLEVRPPAAAQKQGAPPRAAKVERWGAGDRRIRLEAGAATIVTVRESFNPGWRAEAAGDDLRAIKVDGWQQGWLVPAGEAVTLKATFTPDGLYRMALLALPISGLLLLGLALAPARRGERRREAPTRSPRTSHLLLAVVAVVTLAGGVGVVVLTALWFLERRLAPLAAATALAAAGVVAAVDPGLPGSGVGAFGALSQALALAALGSWGLSFVPQSLRSKRWKVGTSHRLSASGKGGETATDAPALVPTGAD